MALLKLFSRRGSITAFKRKQKKVDFELLAPKAKTVSLTGNFIHWDKQGLPMKKSNKGTWKVDVSLCAGKYEYKFIVDDEWRIDPQNSEIVDNPFGSINSVKEVIL